ncbi:MAG TPA: FxsA family protein [Methylophilaceae bacterium]|nr:FxsA family protein [Methylophilaceae bacterium]
MRLLLGLLILLAFPVLEIWILIELGSRYGGWVLAYLVIIAILGWRLIQDERQLMGGRMMQSLRMGGTPAKALFMSGKNLIAGVLLILPGVISDAIAAILLLIPTATEPQFNTSYRDSGAANDDIIEGEFRRED